MELLIVANGRSYFSLPVFLTPSGPGQQCSAEGEADGGIGECFWVDHHGLGLIMHPHLEMPELVDSPNHSIDRPQEAF